jgi:hypothetical protein
VELDGRRLNALSEDGLLDAGTLVRAVRVHAGQIVVRSAAEITAEPAATTELDPTPLS